MKECESESLEWSVMSRKVLHAVTTGHLAFRLAGTGGSVWLQTKGINLGSFIWKASFSGMLLPVACRSAIYNGRSLKVSHFASMSWVVSCDSKTRLLKVCVINQKHQLHPRLYNCAPSAPAWQSNCKVGLVSGQKCNSDTHNTCVLVRVEPLLLLWSLMFL